MVDVIPARQSKRPKQPIDWLTIAKLAFIVFSLYMIAGCSEPEPWERLGHHEPITGKLHGSVSK